MEYDLNFDINLYKAMGVPFSADPDNPWPTEEEYCDWYVQASGKTWKELTDDFQANGWADCKTMDPAYGGTWGFYRRYQLGMLRPDMKPGMQTPTGKMELWNTTMETFFPGESRRYPAELRRGAPVAHRASRA